MTQENKAPPRTQPAPLRENEDYYIENGSWVFTAHFHLNRGYCCGNGCRHCPYQIKDKP